MACGGASEPDFDTWIRGASARCHPEAAVVSTDCRTGACIGILRTPVEVEPDLKGCMAWPYVGMGRQTRTLACGDTSWRLTAVSRLPVLDRESAQSALTAEAERVQAAIAEVSCPEVP